MEKFNIATLDNDFELVKLLGKEIIDKVYLGKNKIDQSLVVIKLIDLKELDEQAITFLSEEGNTLPNLNHPNITNFIDFDIVNNQAYIIMDYAENGNLLMKINEQKKITKPLTEIKIINWFLEICFGIEFIKKMEIVHKCLKTKGILLTKDNHIKLGDIGFIKTFEEELENKNTNEILLYSCPEMIKDEAIDDKSDIWNLGIILYELTQLKHPFDEEDNNEEKIIENISTGKYHPLINKNYSKELYELMDSMFKIEPNDRIELKDIITKCEIIELKLILGPKAM